MEQVTDFENWLATNAARLNANVVIILADVVADWRVMQDHLARLQAVIRTGTNEEVEAWIEQAVNIGTKAEGLQWQTKT